MKVEYKKESSGGWLAARLLIIVAVLFAVHDAEAASDAWTLISSSETNPAAPAPNWSPPDQGGGTGPNPALGDLDGDGDQDLLLGLNGSTGPKLAAYENTGTASAPVWTTAPAGWTNLSASCPDGTDYAPTFADLNGDGLLDMAIGARDAVCFYQNTGTASAPVWTSNGTWKGVLGSLSTNLPYIPALGDVDGDGLVDLLIGGSGATILAYKNVGTATAPVWSFRAAWGGDFINQASAPTLADLDGDGLVDMLIADTQGDIFAFKNMGASAAYRWRFAPDWSPRLSGGLSLSSTGIGLSLGDLNGDGKADLMYDAYSTSNNNGSTQVYEQNPAGVGDPGFVSGSPSGGGSTVTDTFDSFGCTGVWVPAETGSTQGIAGTYQDYSRDCGNGWTAYAEDNSNTNLTPYRWQSGPVGDQNSVTMVNLNGPAAAAGSPLGAALIQGHPDSSRGVLWLLKTFPVVPGSSISVTADFRVGATTNDRTYAGIWVFDGPVTNPSGPTTTPYEPTRPDVMRSYMLLDGPFQCGGSCPWRSVDFSGMIPSNSYITVAARLNNIFNNNSFLLDLDNVTVSNVVNEVPVTLPVGDMAQAWKVDYEAGGTNSGGQSANSAEPAAVETDAAGDVYVVGHEDNGANYDIVTFKYDAAGNQLWKSTYDGGDADKAVALAVDASGNVYVTGRSHQAATASDDFVAIKYDNAGARQWATTYDYLNRDDVPVGLSVDAGGNVYVAGSSCSDPTDCKVATVKYDAAGVEQWHAIYDNGGASAVSTAAGIGLDGAGNVYVTGTSSGSGSNDIVTIKYNGSGSQLRLNRYHTGSNEQAKVMTTDSAGNVYIAGTIAQSGGLAMVAFKYASTALNGDAPQWVKIYDPNDETVPTDLTLDTSGNIYVSGMTGVPADYDFLTVKFQPNGGIAWAQTFGNAGLEDRATGIAVDGGGNVYVVGSYTRNSGNTDMLLLKYDYTGVARSAIAYDGYTVNDVPVGLSLYVDGDGDTAPIVVGASTEGTGRDHIATLHFEKAYPDLTVTAVSGPSGATVGDTISVDNTVLNISDVANKKYFDSGAFTVGLYLVPNVGGTADMDHLTLIGSRNVTNLTPGQTSQDNTSVTIPSSVAEGSYFLVAIADNTAAVLEEDETNNSGTVKSQISISGVLPDLAVTSVTGPTSATHGTPFDVTVTVANLVSTMVDSSLSVTQTTDADFHAGDTTNLVAVENGGVGLLPASADYNPPTPTTVESQQYLGAGTSGSDQAHGPYVVARPGGGYRVYYGYNNGGYWQLAYRDTTDGNDPNGANLGPQVLMNIGTSPTDMALVPFVAALHGGGYRLYYTLDNGSYRIIAYQDTTNPNLPDETNLGGTPTVLLGSGTSDNASNPILLQLPSGGYRLYYSYKTGSYWQTWYVDTTDTNPPDITNLGTAVQIPVTSSTTQSLGGTVVALSGGGYRLYYPYSTGSTNANGWHLAYRDTTDTNPPNETNLGTQVLMGLGSTVNDQIARTQVFQLPSGRYRLIYAYYNGTYWQLAYRDGAGTNTVYNTAGTFSSSVMDQGAAQNITTLYYTDSTPASTALSMEARMGDSAVPDGTWTAWQGGLASGDSLTALLGSHRYVQYRASLSTTDTSATPMLDDVTVAAGDFGPFRVGIYASTSSAITTADTLIGSYTVASLGGNSSVSNTISVTIPTSGTYYVGAIADDQHIIAEADEGNNLGLLAAGTPSSTMLVTKGDFVDGLPGTNVGVVTTNGVVNLRLAQSPVWTAMPAWDLPQSGVANAKAAVGDLDGDGLPDALAGDYLGNIYAYRNVGTPSAPAWTSAPASWRTLSATCNVGNDNSYAVPALADLNGNGLLDLVLGVRNGVCVYKNTGTTAAPVWTYNGTWRTGLGSLTQNRFYVPALVDLDGDGRIDLLLGWSNLLGSYSVLAYRNTGTADTPSWSAQTSWQLTNTSSTDMFSPAVADLNGDGTYDMMVGNQTGSVVAYENTGTTGAPVWTVNSAWNIADPDTSNDNYAGPVLGDLNGDGKVDLQYGNFDGSFFAYQNTGPYATSGTYTSKVFDAGLHGGFTTLHYVDSAPSGTTLSVDIRAGGTATPDGTWTPWVTSIPVDGDISALGAYRYVQYRINLSTTDTGISPALYNIQAMTQAPAPQPVAVSVLTGDGGGGALSWLALLTMGWVIVLGRKLPGRRG